MALKSIYEFFRLIKEKKTDFDTRRSPSKLPVSIFESISHVPESEWQKVVPPGKTLMHHPYLRAIENSSNGNHRSRYALIYKGDVPVAAAIFNIVQLRAEDYGVIVEDDGKLDLIKKSFKEKVSLRVLVCGHTHISGDHGFVYSSEISSKEAYHALADTCYRIKHAEKLRGKIDIQLIKDFYEEEFERSAYLSIFKYHQFKVDPNMVLNLRGEWHEFEDYLQAMNTKYRKKTLGVVRLGAALERKELASDDIRQNYDSIQKLYSNVANKAKVRINQFDTSYFIELKINLGHTFKFTAYYVGEDMVAFSTIIFWGGNCEAHAIGLNYELNEQLSIYQNMLYDFVKESIKSKSKKLILGRTAMEMKSNIGAEPYEMCCYVRHSGPLLNRAFKPVFNYIKQTEWTQRNPFKESNPKASA
jgi:predicted N-acyltransferase